MSHVSFPSSMLSRARTWALIEKIDAAETDRCRMRWPLGEQGMHERDAGSRHDQVRLVTDACPPCDLHELSPTISSLPSPSC